MASDSKKPGLLLASFGMGKSKSKEAPAAPTSAPSESSDFESAADAAFDAVKEDDREGFRAALKLAMASCQDDASATEE